MLLGRHLNGLAVSLLSTEIVLFFSTRCRAEGRRRDVLYLTLLQGLSFGLLGADRCELNIDMMAYLLLMLRICLLESMLRRTLLQLRVELAPGDETCIVLIRWTKEWRMIPDFFLVMPAR